MFFEEDSPENVTRPIRTMQIIALALILGAVLFLCVVLFIRHNQPDQAGPAQPAGGMPLISLICTLDAGESASVSFARTLGAPPARVVTVPPSATGAASGAAPGASFTGVMATVTVAAAEAAAPSLAT